MFDNAAHYHLEPDMVENEGSWMNVQDSAHNNDKVHQSCTSSVESCSAYYGHVFR